MTYQSVSCHQVSTLLVHGVKPIESQAASATQQMQSYFSEIEDPRATHRPPIDILSTDKEPTMIAVFVCFRYGEFNEAYVRQIADGARAKFEGMLGSR